MAYFEKERRELVGLNYAEPVRSPLSAASPEALGYSHYFAELIDEWAAEADVDERLFRLGTAALEALVARRAAGGAGALLRVLAVAAAGRVSVGSLVFERGGGVCGRRAKGRAARGGVARCLEPRVAGNRTDPSETDCDAPREGTPVRSRAERIAAYIT